MRHRVFDKKFNRTTNERKALLSGLMRNLTERGEITTTETRAKVLKRMADRMIGKAQTSNIATRRNLHKTFGKRDVVNTLVDVIAPSMKERKSGFTRIIPVGHRRGDNVMMVKLQLLTKPEKTSLKSGVIHPERFKKAAELSSAKGKLSLPKTEKKVAAKPAAKPVKKVAAKKQVKK